MIRRCLVGALLGLAVSLATTLSMGARTVRTVAVPGRPGQRVQVYGAVGPYAPRRLSLPTTRRSPATLRDALLGLLAGGLVTATLLNLGAGGSGRRG